jgi:hypothetical protein
LVRTSLIDGNTEVGLAVGGAELLVEGSIVRNTLSRPFDLWHGHGVHAQPFETGTTTVTLLGSVVSSNVGAAVLAVAAHLHVEASVLSDTHTRADGLFGDGVLVAADRGVQGSATLAYSIIHNNGRAGIGAIGGSLELGTTRSSCNPVDLTTEAYDGTESTLNDLGDNLCGCDGEVGECRAISANLGPPAALGL